MSTNPPLQFLAVYSKFETARDAIQAHRTAHRRVFDTDDLLCSAYNDALKEVKEEYRKNSKSIGGKYGEFKATYQTVLDAPLFIKLMKDKADAYIKVERKIDREKYIAAVKANLIPVDVQAVVESEKLHSITGPSEV